MAELRPYDPPLREYLGSRIYQYANALGLPANRMRNQAQAAMDFVPGLGDVVGAQEAKRDYDAGNYLGATIGAGATALGMVPIVGDALGKGLKAGAKGIKAYHGSPHDFDKFSMDKIGTGEGAQAYGHGLYFAENEGVARNYKDALGRPVVDGDALMFSGLSPESQEGIKIAFSRSDPQNMQDVIDSLKEYAGEQGSYRISKQVEKITTELGENLDKPVRAGRMYEVNIDANPDDFLDWDKPLSEQPENVKKVMLAIESERPEFFGGVRRTIEENLSSGAWGKYKGRDFFDALSSAMKKGNVEHTSTVDGFSINQQGSVQSANKLRQAGIPGIKYLDQGSRGAGEGSRNYVVFDDKLISIVKKYGIAAAIGAGLITREQAEEMTAQGAI